MEEKATHGIDGRFAEHDHSRIRSADGEESKIFLGARSHTAPGCRSYGSTQFGADGPVFFSKQQKDGIGASVGIELAGLAQSFNQREGDAALMDEILFDDGKIAGGRRWQSQRAR